MSTSAQVAANQQNAQSSTGPRTQQGKAISALNNFRHGFTGAFCILPWEEQDEYDLLYGGLLDDHRPSNTTEHVLVKNMAQSCWLHQRALTLQQMCFDHQRPMCDADCQKQLALYLRYQTTHDRAFNKALDQLQKLRAKKRKEQRDEAALSQRAEDSRIGFESQERKRQEQARKQTEAQATAERRQAEESRRQAAANRAAELHQARLWLTEAQARRHETETKIAELHKMPRSQRSEVAKAA
jgi:hypothetical protein